MTLWKVVMVAAAMAGTVWIAGRLVYPVPDTKGRPIETAIPFDPGSELGLRAVEAMASHSGLTGVVPLVDPVQALESRLHLARRATASLDVMYYIWHADLSGLLLLDELRAAADRGVRVRLLLDDNGIDGMDAMLAALNAHPNISVRLFNPSTVRDPKLAGYLLHPLRMNRRMHNKAFIVDGAVAIVGGRNIGDEYFAVGDAPAYLDLDVIGVGDVVPRTAAVFDDYWNSSPVIELERLVAGPGDPAALEDAVARARADPEAGRFAPDETTPSARVARGSADGMEWTRVEVVAADPAKGAGDVPIGDLMISRLGRVLDGVDRRLSMISAYFVPGRRGTEFFSALARQGHEVVIMTNAWTATDVPMVHAGYVKYRRDLLEAGVILHELRPIDGQSQGPGELGFLGSSGSSIHAKTFALDDNRLFIGSFNFDPRSIYLNCEMGFLIASDSLARNSRLAVENLARRSFQPMLGENGDMVWQETAADGTVTLHPQEPGLDVMDRVAVYVLNVLPIEWLL